ncbi:alkaline phosphatase family protein [Halobaculum magnesiiphilum]|uniref:Alkaline phosphatase family protein n=1 Tax=Halobaculum magnesiiphilum TaxID=1017351 RepID=A0A8T8WCG0_9EURY|nr:alkaline phosphatase family protein [Halobaculum magnesiiphilum]QZP37525.1 alkaline phosphatase family protein [Halobaculum magnesiiphilum]
MTLVILAIDALDTKLVEHYDIDEYRLDGHTQMETVAHQFEHPFTPEAWATVATGLHPTEHGVTEEGTSSWDNPLIDFASQFVGHLDVHTRAWLGNKITALTGEEYTVGVTDSPTIFDPEYAVVHNWPGVANGAELRKTWQITDGDPPKEYFERELKGMAVQQFAWAREMAQHPISLGGVHVHTVDMASHAYGEQEDELERLYRWTADQVRHVREGLGEDDELLILSDHGSYTSFLDPGEVPGKHAFRAFASTTHPDGPPESVFDVKEWVEERIDVSEYEESNLDLPKEQLRDLGYID